MALKITKTNFYTYYILIPKYNKIRIRACYTKGFIMQTVLDDYYSIEEYSKLSGYSELEIWNLINVGMYNALRFKQKWYIKKQT